VASLTEDSCTWTKALLSPPWILNNFIFELQEKLKRQTAWIWALAMVLVCLCWSGLRIIGPTSSRGTKQYPWGPCTQVRKGPRDDWGILVTLDGQVLLGPRLAAVIRSSRGGSNLSGHKRRKAFTYKQHCPSREDYDWNFHPPSPSYGIYTSTLTLPPERLRDGQELSVCRQYTVSINFCKMRVHISIEIKHIRNWLEFFQGFGISN
jgi:hypothetical protein